VQYLSADLFSRLKRKIPSFLLFPLGSGSSKGTLGRGLGLTGSADVPTARGNNFFLLFFSFPLLFWRTKVIPQGDYLSPFSLSFLLFPIPKFSFPKTLLPFGVFFSKVVHYSSRDRARIFNVVS
jgi:hypothetical protein